MFDPMNSIPSGMGNAAPYGQADPTSAAASMLGNSAHGSPMDSATGEPGYKPESAAVQPYRPEAMRADRLSANIVTPTGGGYTNASSPNT